MDTTRKNRRDSWESVERYLDKRLKNIEPKFYPKTAVELDARLRRKKFRLIKGGRYEPPQTLEGSCTL